MYPISAAVAALFEAENKPVLRITGTDKNNTSISITDADVPLSGFTIDRYSCNGEKLELGTAIAGEMTLKLDNTNGTFDNTVFEGTELYVEVGTTDWTQVVSGLEVTTGGIDFNTGASTTTNTRAHIEQYVNVDSNIFTVMLGAVTAEYAIFFYTDAYQYISYTGWLTSSSYTIPNNAAYLRASFRYTDSRVMSDSDLEELDGIINVSPKYYYIPIGYFTPDEQPRKLTTISITALDRMVKFDKLAVAANLTFPDTIAGLIGQICTVCGVTLGTTLSTLPNYNYSVTALPNVQQTITYRTLIQWCAGIMGTCAFIDWEGKLQFKWYTAASYTSTMAKRFTSDLYEDDIQITGIKYTDTQSNTTVSGKDDYALDMTGNYLIGANASTILPNIGNAINGYTYRPFSASILTAPWLWPLDVITFTDKDGNDYNCAVTNVNFSLKFVSAIAGVGTTAQLNSGTSYSGITTEQSVIIEQAIEATLTDVDETLTQQDIFNRLTNNGSAQGVILYNGQIYINASYMRSGTIDGDYVNAKLLQIVDGNGDVIATFDDTITLGKSGQAQSSFDFNSFELEDKNGAIIVILGDVRDENGIAELTEKFIGDGTTKTFSLQASINSISIVNVDGSIIPSSDYTTSTNSITFNSAPADGARISIEYTTTDAVYRYDLGDRKPSTTIGKYSVVEGFNNEASGKYSHAEGQGNAASGIGSHVEGLSTTASGSEAHAEGLDTEAQGATSHAEGTTTTASGTASHAEGASTTASGTASHAEGSGTTASGNYSHADGRNVLATGRSQHVFGEYNAQETVNTPSTRGTYIEIVGNGTSGSNRSNARTLDWSGNEILAGALSVGDVPTTVSNLGLSVLAQLVSGYSNTAGFHNSFFRGKDLGTSLTAEQSASIVAGTFDDLFVGDYWVINGVTWRIADFDTYYNTGSTAFTSHHVVVVPDANLYTDKWNSTASTSMGYVGCSLRTNIQATGGAEEMFVSAFGSTHVLSYSANYPSAYTNGVATNRAWANARVELLSEIEVFGEQICGAAGGIYEAGASLRQLSLFRLNYNFINTRQGWWLRNVASSANAARMTNTGIITSNAANVEYGVRPFALIA